MKTHFVLRLIAIGLIPLGFLGCASSNPNSEVMTDTSSQNKQRVYGETPQRVTASQLGQSTVGDQ